MKKRAPLATAAPAKTTRKVRAALKILRQMAPRTMSVVFFSDADLASSSVCFFLNHFDSKDPSFSIRAVVVY